MSVLVAHGGAFDIEDIEAEGANKPFPTAADACCCS